jgi:hypothetical protein
MNATTPGDPIAGPAGRGLDSFVDETNGGDVNSPAGISLPAPSPPMEGHRVNALGKLPVEQSTIRVQHLRTDTRPAAVTGQPERAELVRKGWWISASRVADGQFPVLEKYGGAVAQPNDKAALDRGDGDTPRTRNDAPRFYPKRMGQEQSAPTEREPK